MSRSFGESYQLDDHFVRSSSDLTIIGAIRTENNFKK